MLKVFVTVEDTGEDDATDRLTGRLREELRQLDGISVNRISAGQDDIPEGAKGVASIVGWLAIQVSAAGGLRTVIAAVADWIVRTRRTVRVTVGDDALELSHATPAEQAAIVEAFIARHEA